MSSHISVTVKATDIAEAVFACAHHDNTQSWKMPDTGSPFDSYYLTGTGQEFRDAAYRLNQIADEILSGEACD